MTGAREAATGDDNDGYPGGQRRVDDEFGSQVGLDPLARS